jgi:hypothetical protein
MIKAGFTTEIEKEFELMPLDVIFKHLYDTKLKGLEEEKIIKSKEENAGKKQEIKDQFYAE